MQHSLFHDSIRDALGADIAAIGGIKKVAGMLWPSLDATSAAAKLRSCLNPEQPHKLDPDEMLMIKRWARDAGSTATVTYEERALGFRAQWTSPEDEQARLQREFVGAVEKLDRIRREIGANESRLAAVRR